ncbi:MAG: SGNH/GDSL hydrolase family protein [Nitrospirae bacterium]|nr:SGNH/GDSL hydrolase family protein [Nitrospirota bacterium]
MNRAKNFIKNIAVLLIGIVLSFIILEGILRIYNPFESRVKGDKIVLPVNKEYIIENAKLRKRFQKSLKKFDDTIIHRKNSLGFRGEKPPRDFADYLTIVTVGGSTTECTFLSEGKTWTDVLGKKLKRKFNRLWINNAGFDGHSTFGHIILMEDYIIKLKPDMVLFLVGANDQDRQDIGEQDMGIMRNQYVFYSMKSFLKSMANHSEVFSLGLNIYRYYKAKEIGVEHQEIDFENFRNVDVNQQFIDGKIRFEKEALRFRESKLSQGYERRLKTLINISKDNNIEPVLLTQPSLYGNFVDDVTNINFKFISHAWDSLELFNDITRKVGAEEHVLVVDLARKMPKSTKYYYDWFHFTNEGAEKVAENIYNSLYPYMTVKYNKYMSLQETALQ